MEDETSKFHSKGMSVMLLQGGYLNVSANCLASPVDKNVLLMSALIMPLGFGVLSVIMKSIVFRNVAPCSLLKPADVLEENIAAIFRFEELRCQQLCLPPAFLVAVSCSAYSLTLKMEAICSSKISVAFQCGTQRNIPEDGTLLVLCV
jgi:hypothetical protein